MVKVKLETKDSTLRIKFFSSDKNEWVRALAKVRALKGARFDGKEKVWTAPDTDENIEAVSRLGKINPPELLGPALHQPTSVVQQRLNRLPPLRNLYPRLTVTKDKQTLSRIPS